jgi:hypothetical protein
MVVTTFRIGLLSLRIGLGARTCRNASHKFETLA